MAIPVTPPADGEFPPHPRTLTGAPASNVLWVSYFTYVSTWQGFVYKRLAEACIEPSVGSVGDSHVNALAETINGRCKTEVIRRRGKWRNLEVVEIATLEWVDWVTNRRLPGPIGDIPPADAEVNYHAQGDALDMVAQSGANGLRQTWGGPGAVRTVIHVAFKA